MVRRPPAGARLAGRSVTPFAALSVQSTLSLAVFSLIAAWHVEPRLRARPREDALVPLLWVQVFRYAPLSLYAPGQVDPRIPADVAAAVGLGDLVSALAALAAVVALRIHLRGAIALVWFFTVVGVSDLLFATMKAVAAEMYRFPMGWNWYILNFYVPMIVVGHVLIVRHLL